jgi:hypothetical protein
MVFIGALQGVGVDVDIKEHGLQVIRDLNLLIDEIQIPDDVFKEVGLSGFAVNVWEATGAGYEDKLRSATEDFERLCNSSIAPPDAVKAISLAYAAISILFDETHEWPGDNDAMKTIMVAQFGLGSAWGVVHGTSSAMIQRRKGLSEAGRRGADTRNRPYELLKGWALEKASEMRGSDREIARKLAPRVPAHLAEASKDPMRLIYEALRAKPRNLI